MRVLVTGADGQVGTELRLNVPEWVELIALNSRQLDITDLQAVEVCMAQYRPQLIINAAAYTAVDRAQTEQQQAHAVNASGPANLARSAETAGAALFHISTDYVFDGVSESPYDESALTSPQTVYGRTKLDGEQAVAELCTRHLILRTSWVFSAHGGNFVKTMLRLASERDVLRVVADQYGGPTSAKSIAACLWTLASEYRGKPDSFCWGLFHFSGAPISSWYGFAEHIVAVAAQEGLIEKRPLVEPIPSTDFPTPAPRPAFSALNCDKIRDFHAVELSDWREDLSAVFATLGRL
ncbi:dTDP-4-dehydrorhamnose reductase [Halopseudomonas sp.]|uniref:dTDP-4-dehydrorhamnose reductase n=1 Tax=Halopseudomonas sp. TaxID=2901191 RepID=UPI003001308D